MGGLEEAFYATDPLLGDFTARAVLDLLSGVRGVWVFDLVDTANDGRLLGLVRAVTLPDRESPLVVLAKLRAQPESLPWNCSLRCVDLPDLTNALEDLAREVVPRLRTAPGVPMQPVLWIGGSSHEAGDTEWAERLRTLGLAHGLDIRIQPQPYRYGAASRTLVNQFPGPMIAVWDRHSGGNDWGADAKASDRVLVKHLAETHFDQAMSEFEASTNDIPEPDEPEVEPGTRTQPTAGEVRFYKKHFSRRGGGDKMLEFHDCGHNKWTDDAYAPQARIGIQKLEGVDTLPKLQKCKTCTGGGVWKVTY